MKEKRFGVRSALRVAIIYALFAGIWVLFTDRLLGTLIADPRKIIELEIFKGWAFVAVSAVLLFMLVHRELRTRARAEEALGESEEKYRALMQNANDGIVIVDAETGVILEVNKRFEELVGMPAEKIIGMRQSELYPREEKEHCRRLFEEVVKGRGFVSGEFCVYRRDSRHVPVEISAGAIEVDGRKLIQAIFRDITERRKVEEELRTERDRAAKYLNVADVILRALDAEGRVSLINKKGCDILGYEEQEILGKNWFDSFVPERVRDEVKDVFHKLMTGELTEGEYYENPIVNRGGEEKIIAWHNTLVRDDGGKVVATLSSGEDITARKQAEEQARYRLEHLATLHVIDMIVSSSLDLRVTLQEFLNFVISQLHVDAADVLLLNPHTQVLEFGAHRGFRSEAIRHTRLRLGKGIAGHAALEHRTISVPNLLDPESGFIRNQLLEEERFIAYHVVPLIAKGKVKGVLEILNRSPLAFNAELTDFIESLAAQAAIAIDNAEMFNELQHTNSELILAYDTTIEGWSRAMELRDKETEGHTKRAAEMTLRIARAMGMKEEDLVHVRRGALLHDIGKMIIPDVVLMKTGPLTPEEWEIMRRHPTYAFELLTPIPYLRQAIDIPYCHHERWDGTGYPRGLKGEQIPLAARIFSLADTWDALCHERRYHEAWSEERICDHIRSLAGTQFDPKVVQAFTELECSGSAGRPACAVSADKDKA